MKFLQRLMGGDDSPDTNVRAGVEVDADGAPDASAPGDGGEPPADGDEQARELSLLKEEHRRLDDLAQRQQRYAQYSWEPARQGGDRRADDQAES